MKTTKINSSSFYSEKSEFPKNAFNDPKPLQEFIFQMLRENGLSNSEVWHNAFGPEGKQIWHSYYSGKSIPTKENARRLVVGLHCTPNEAKHLLELCGYCFIPANKVDECILNYLENKHFNMTEICLEVYEESLAA